MVIGGRILANCVIRRLAGGGLCGRVYTFRIFVFSILLSGSWTGPSATFTAAAHFKTPQQATPTAKKKTVRGIPMWSLTIPSTKPRDTYILRN
jgi:hypothetical protein